MPPRAPAAVLRAAARRGPAALVRAARAAGPDAVARAWPRLSAAERVAAFRALDARAARALFAALDDDGRWLAYLGALSDGAAPLREAGPGVRLPRPSAAARAAMRRALR